MKEKEQLYYLEFEVINYNEFYNKHYYKKIYDLTNEQATKLYNNLINDNETEYLFKNIGKQ